jgi:hypothetical protein
MAGLQRVCTQLLPSDEGVCLPLCIIEIGSLLFEKFRTWTIIVRANDLFYIYIYTHTDHVEPLSVTGGKVFRTHCTETSSKNYRI